MGKHSPISLVGKFLLIAVLGYAALLLLANLLARHDHDPERRNTTTCMMNLRYIGQTLMSHPDQERLRRHSGAAYLLQISERLPDEHLKVFLCLGEPDPPARPDPGSAEFAAMYRSVTDWSALDEATLAKLCSYAGPNWRDHPYVPAPGESRVLAADACRGGKSHHRRGSFVLFDDGSVRQLRFAEMEGVDGESFTVGPDSPDSRLRTLVFYPEQR